MDAEAAKRQAFEAGLSDGLLAAFANVAEASTFEGEVMFSRAVSHDLAKFIACRHYAKLALQLAHLVNIADATSGDSWETLFYSGNRASPSAFRGQISERLERGNWRRQGFEVTAEGISVSYEDGRFNVPFSRMPILSALMYFLMETLGYGELEATFSEMLENAARQKAIGDAANRMSRGIYDYLGDHLRPAQEQAKFEQIVSFLSERSGGEQSEIDDAAILDFWRLQTESADEADFKQYRSALRAIVAFVKAMERGKSKGSVARTLSIGEDRDAGEISPESLAAAMEMDGEWQSPLPELDTEPANQIRFLNSREVKDVSLLMDLGPLAFSWPLSLLRYETFGFTQARLMQAARSSATPEEVTKIASCMETESFLARIKRIGDLASHAMEILKASAWIIEEAARERPDENAEEIVMAPHMLEARRAFKKINRQGFSENAASSAALVAGHRAGMEAMLRLRDKLSSWHEMAEKMKSAAPGLTAQFELDKDCFRDGFNRLYGEQA